MQKIAILFLLLVGAVSAGVLDTVWQAPNRGEFMDPYPVVTLADGRQFLQVVRNDTLTCISTKDGSVIWQFDVSDAVERLDTPHRAGILDFNWDGTADFWKVVPGSGRICTLKVVGLEDSFRVNMVLADEWVFPVAMESFSGVLALTPAYDSLYIYLVDFSYRVIFRRTTEGNYGHWYAPQLLGTKGDYIGFWACQNYPRGDGGFIAKAFDINVVTGEFYSRDLGRRWYRMIGDGYHATSVEWESWGLICNNYLTDFTVLSYLEEGERFFDGPSGEHYESISSGFVESSFFDSRAISNRPNSPKGRFILNFPDVNYFFNRSNSLYFSDKFVSLVDSEFPTSLLKFKYGFAQDGMIISSEDSIYGVVFNILFINRGWNLFSNPFAEPLPISEVFGFSCILPAYSWNNEDKIYNLTDILAPGQVAWVFSLDSGFVEIPPIPAADTLTYTLYPGWNLIGVPREGALASKITESPAVLNAVFGFDPQTNSYFVADTLQPFCGYWVFTTDTVNIAIP